MAHEHLTIPIDKLVILPFEGMPAHIVQALTEDLAARGVSAMIDTPVPLPDAAYARARGQYRAAVLLELVRGHSARHVLGLTHRDLFAHGLNFVFGIADAPGKACMVSIARLAAGADERRFRMRTLKEVVHELGHTLGLQHCPDARCVMHFSNSLPDTDRKSDVYCRRCMGRLTHGTGARQ